MTETLTADKSAVVESPVLVLTDALAQTLQTGIPSRGVGKELYDRGQEVCAQQDEPAALQVLSRAVALVDYTQAIGWYRGLTPDGKAIYDRALRVLKKHGYRPETLDLEVKLSLERKDSQRKVG